MNIWKNSHQCSKQLLRKDQNNNIRRVSTPINRSCVYKTKAKGGTFTIIRRTHTARFRVCFLHYAQPPQHSALIAVVRLSQAWPSTNVGSWKMAGTNDTNDPDPWPHLEVEKSNTCREGEFWRRGWWVLPPCHIQLHSRSASVPACQVWHSLSTPYLTTLHDINQ